MESQLQNVNTILFDWGDTLMRDFGLPGPMYTWSEVEVFEDVLGVLEHLSNRYQLGVATNANESGAGAVRRALERGGIAQYFGPIYSSSEIGFRKPQPQFFDYILKDLKLSEDRLCMVGDSFTNDVVASLGIASFWLNRGGDEIRRGHGYRTIKSLEELIFYFR